MTRFPREPLDADERALAAALPRPHGRAEPDAGLDARILAAAHAATQAPAVRPRKRRWAVPLGLAASLCLALGLAWRTQLDVPTHAAPVAVTSPAPQPSLDAAPMPQAADAGVTLRAESAPASVAAPSPPAPRSAATAKSAPPPIDAPVAPDEPSVMREMRSPPAIAPPPAPSAPPPIANADAAPRAFASEAMPAPPHTLDKALANRARSVAPAQRAFPTQDDAPVEDVPPATADSPDVRNAWLRRIGELMEEGKLDLARASLAEFRRRYPDAIVPIELRPLEQPSGPPEPTLDPAAH